MCLRQLLHDLDVRFGALSHRFTPSKMILSIFPFFPLPFPFFPIWMLTLHKRKLRTYLRPAVCGASSPEQDVQPTMFACRIVDCLKGGQ